MLLSPKVDCQPTAWVLFGHRHSPAGIATSAPTYERTIVEVRTEVSKDTLLPPQLKVAVRFAGFRIVYREAAAELVSILLEELKEPFINDVVVAQVHGEHVLRELLPPPGAVPEVRVEFGDTLSGKKFFGDLYPRSGGRRL